MQNYTIITLDGGGFHGVITAMILNDLESSFPGILENVSLFGGNSIGALNAIGLASRLMTTEDLIRFYETQGELIFQRYQPSQRGGGRAAGEPRLGLSEGLHRAVLCHMLPELCYPQYTNEGWLQALEPHFGDVTIGDLKTSALVTTFVLSSADDARWGPLALHNLSGTPFLDVKLRDAIMCSASPPAMFPPYYLPTVPARWCADGALFANNPTMFTLAYALRANLSEAGGKTSTDLRVLSVGTGVNPYTIPFDNFGDPFNWGVYRWLNPYSAPPQPALPVLAAFWDGQSEVDAFQADLILGSDRYRRANVMLPEFIAIDDFQAVPQLEEWAQDYIASEEWQAIKQWVKQEFV